MPLARKKPRAVVRGFSVTLPSGKVRVSVTSNAKKVKLIYRTAKNKKRTATIRLRAGAASKTLAKGSKKIYAQALATSRLRASLRIRVLPVSADIDRDGVVGCADQALLQADWGTSSSRSDLDGDGVVGVLDLSILLARWTAEPGPCGPSASEQVAVEAVEERLAPGESVDVIGNRVGPGGMDLVALQYKVSGVPMLGAQAVVGVADREVVLDNDQAPPPVSINTRATVTPSEALAAARTRVADALGVDVASTNGEGEPSLVILDPVRLGLEYPDTVTLTWSVLVTVPAGPAWQVFVDAHAGTVAWSSVLADAAMDRRVCDKGRWDFNSEVPCTTPERAEGEPATGNALVDAAYDHMGYAYGYFKDVLGRDSYDGRGAPIRATVSVEETGSAMAHYRAGGYLTFHPGFEQADDVVAHEFAHLVTRWSPAGGLQSTVQAGAINEGMSDIFGEFVDWRNPAGDDSPAARWKIAEDIPELWSGRDMKNPANSGQAAAVGDDNWIWEGSDTYKNMGVATRLAYLLTDGQGDIRGLGQDKAARLLYTAGQSLTNAATFAELARQLRWACQTFQSKSLHGITAADCGELDEALFEVRMVRVNPPAHPSGAGQYIVRDPATGRSVLVNGSSVNLIMDEDFDCLARTRVVWHASHFEALVGGADGVQLNCFDAGPAWTYTPNSQGGNTGTNIILRNSRGNAWFVNGSGVIQPIDSGGAYRCLARSYPVLWNVPDAKIAAWQPSRSQPASCGSATALECSEITVLPNDDSSSEQVALPMTITFGGRQFSSAWVNNNGNVTFDGSMSTYTPFDLVASSRMLIAPFFADVDTRPAGSGLATAGRTSYEGKRALCVNWDTVGYYNQHADKTNSFQLLMVDRSDVAQGSFDIVFNYTNIDWETGDASGGRNGFGGTSATVGYSAGTGRGYELPGSRSVGSFLDDGPRALVANSNVAKPGRYVIEIRP
jgi:Zn-dependent metalloprotease